jgi:5-methylcytosine-specific restriction endonuclease McrBC GTP-binding regulatory subunit McrB
MQQFLISSNKTLLPPLQHLQKQFFLKNNIFLKIKVIFLFLNVFEYKGYNKLPSFNTSAETIQFVNTYICHEENSWKTMGKCEHLVQLSSYHFM